MSVVGCQVEVSATGLSHIMRSLAECGVPNECDCEASLGDGHDTESCRCATGGEE